MKAIVLMLVLLANEGYWFAGQKVAVTLQRNVEGVPAEITVEWFLRLDGVVLSSGQTTVGPNETRIELVAPDVRVPTRLEFLCRFRASEGRVLEEQVLPAHVFPRPATGALLPMFQGQRVAVVDGEERISGFLRQLGIQCQVLPEAGRLALEAPGITVIGEDRLQWAADAMPLARLAQAGGRILVLRQSTGQIVGYDSALRTAQVPLLGEWKHPILAGLGPDDWQTLIRKRMDLRFLQLPAREPALVLLGREPEQRTQPAPRDALLVSKTIGGGRIVWCQVPLSDWEQDPRCWKLLEHLTAYLLIRPEPTPAEQFQPLSGPAASATVPVIPIEPGGRP